MNDMGAKASKAQAAELSKRLSLGTTNHFAFLLLKGFSALSYVTAVDTLRIANRAAGETIFTWVTLSEDGHAVTSNQGLQQSVEARIGSLDRRTTLLICGGERIERASTPRILAWVREQAAHGCHVGGLCTAAWTLAEAGLLASAKTTIHWESEDSFLETFPLVVLTRTPFVIDGNRSATAGGTASIDLMLEFISRLFDRDLAIATSDRLLYGSIHKLQDNSKITRGFRTGLGSPKLRLAVEFMEANIDGEISPIDVANEIRISVRQLERIFRKYLRKSPKEYLTDLRLDRGQRLLVQTNMSVIEVAMAVGFSSASHFSKAFGRRFGQSPYRLRTTFLGRA